jgi:hypothetical protein
MANLLWGDSFKSGTSVSDLFLGRWATDGRSGTGSIAIGASTGRFSGQGLTITFGNANTYILATSKFANQATACLNVAVKITSLPATATGICNFFDVGTAQLSLVLNAAGTISVYRGAENGTVLATSTFVVTTAVWYLFEIKATFATGTGGTIEVRCYGPGAPSSGVIIGPTSSLNTSNSGNAYCNGYAIGRVPNINSGAGVYVYEHIAALDDFVGDKRFYTAAPNGTTSTQWTPNASTNLSRINEAAEDGDTTYNSDSNPGDTDLFTFAATPSNITGIIGLIISAWWRKDDAGTRQIKQRVQSNSVNQDGATVNVSTTYAEQLDISGTDPNTSAAWAKAGVDAMSQGYVLVA